MSTARFDTWARPFCTDWVVSVSRHPRPYVRIAGEDTNPAPGFIPGVRLDGPGCATPEEIARLTDPFLNWHPLTGPGTLDWFTQN